MSSMEMTQMFLQGQISEEDYNLWIAENSTESRVESAFLAISLGEVIQSLFGLFPILVVVALGLKVAGNFFLTIGRPVP